MSGVTKMYLLFSLVAREQLKIEAKIQFEALCHPWLVGLAVRHIALRYAHEYNINGSLSYSEPLVARVATI